MDEIDEIDGEEEESSIPPEDFVQVKRGPGRPKGSKNRVQPPEDPEGIPEFSSSDEPPKKRRGRPPGSKNAKKGGTKLPIPPGAIAALGNAPYMLVGQLYATRTGRSLDFTNPEQVRAMHQASLDALAAWMIESGVEAPAWLVYAGTTAMCMGAAISIDQMKLRAENQLKASSMPRPPVVKKEEKPPATNEAIPVVKPLISVPLNDSDKRAGP